MNKLKKLTTYLFLSIIILTTIGNGFIFAESSADLQKDIDAQQQALQQAQNDLDAAKANLDYYNNALAQSEGGIPQIEAQIQQVQAQIDYNQKQLDIVTQQQQITELEKEKKVQEREESVKSTYMDWRSKSNNIVKLLGSQKSEYDLKKSAVYSNIVINDQQQNILGLNSELETIAGELDSYTTQKNALQASNDDLAKKKTDLENAVAMYSSAIGTTKDSISAFQSNIINVENKISILSAQQKDAYLEEARLAAQAGSGGQSVAGCVTSDDGNNDNNIEFCGIGNDFQQGNAVGLSQYGALGMAQKGFTAEQILKFYYTGVDVPQYALSPEITVKYCSDYPALDAYQSGGGCNPGAQLIVERVSFDQYLSGLGEVPSSWPLEARRAQIIAARTYAVNYTHNGDPNYPICLTTYCQVSYFKNGDTSEADAVQSTKDLIITYGGTPIEALYGSDNNQGFGTANNETIFQNFDGSGTAVPYLRSVNDSGVAAQGPYTSWGYKTITYSMDDINYIISWTIAHDGGGFANYLQGVKNQLGGKATKISFERDPSLRVTRVILQTQGGTTAYIGGWWFTYMYNVYNLTNGNSNDLLFSQTFFVHVK